MNKQGYFLIEDRKLYLDEILIDFEREPMLFTCKSINNDYYLALCTDKDNFAYIAVDTTSEEIYDMLNKKITMQEMFLNKPYYYEICQEIDIEEDRVSKKDISQIDIMLLPYKGEYYGN